MPIRYPLPQTPPLQRKPRSRRLGDLGPASTAIPGVTATVVLAAPAGVIAVTLPGVTAALVFVAPVGSVTVGVAQLPEIVLRTRVAC